MFKKTKRPPIQIQDSRALGSLIDNLPFVVNPMIAELDAGGYKITNLGDATDLKDAVNLNILLENTGLGLHYFLQGSNILSQTAIDAEGNDQETVTTDPDTMSTIYYKSTVADTPAPFSLAENTIVAIHTSMKVNSTTGKKTIKVKLQFGYVDSDGTSNFVQIGADSDFTDTLTTAQTPYKLHFHVTSETSVPSGKRLWIKVITTVVNDGPVNYPDLWVYNDAPAHHIEWTVEGSILNNYGNANIATGNYTGNGSGATRVITSSLDFQPKYITNVNSSAGKYWVKNENQTPLTYQVNAAGSFAPSIVIDSNGFTVGGDGNNYCNVNTQAYYWVAIG